MTAEQGERKAGSLSWMALWLFIIAMNSCGILQIQVNMDRIADALDRACPKVEVK